MNQLPPANINALRGILGKSKTLMDMVESDNYERGNLDASMMIDSSQLVEGNQVGGQQPMQQRAPQSMNVGRGYNEQMVNNSKLPANIKEAMRAHPIPQMDPSVITQSFTLEDMGDLVEKPLPNPQARQQQRINEQQYRPAQQQINMGDDAIRNIVKEELIKLLGGEFTKKIRESAIKSTIQTLIKEGKVKTVAKKRV